MSDSQVAVILSTWNRADLLPTALEALVSQDTRGVRYRIVIVDNNSKDHTAQVVKEWAGRAPGRIDYVFEGKQGLSYARNAGIAYAVEPLLAFTDDDVCVSPDWIWSIVQAFRDFPDASFIGGKVLPLWTHGKPKWASEGMDGLATQDFGDHSFPVNSRVNRPCLVGANLVCRRELFLEVGTFAPELQRVKDSIGSMEDEDFEARAVAAGKVGVYDPRLVVTAPIPLDRLQKQYHRRWHFGHGVFLCKRKDPALEHSSRTILGVPGHIYRAAASDLTKCVAAKLKGRSAEAFSHEISMYRSLGFLYERLRERIRAQ